MSNKSTLNEYLNYDPETGLLNWKKRTGPRCKIELPVGALSDKGYLRFNFQGKQFMCHRAIWIMVHGKIDGQIDHINGIKTDNRIVNLRDVSQHLNMRNRVRYKTEHIGPVGVYKTRHGRYEARISDEYIGTYLTEAEAHAARSAVMGELGFTNRHGE